MTHKVYYQIELHWFPNWRTNQNRICDNLSETYTFYAAKEPRRTWDPGVECVELWSLIGS